jgi:tRNA threonylcarbamoyladenosine biosynthesis protein TsaB
VRVLGIETSTSQASIALIENGQLVLARESARPKQSAERLLPMIAELLEAAAWPRGSLDRIGVSLGPGSFTGLRIGIACAQGLALGLGVPLLGVTSLRAMARAVPARIPGLRCAVLDARRAEVFVGGYSGEPGTAEVIAPLALSCNTARESIERRLPPLLVWIGSGLQLLGLTASFSSAETEAPSAHAIGLLAEELEPADCPPTPVYVRDAGATLPDLPAPPGR